MIAPPTDQAAARGPSADNLKHPRGTRRGRPGRAATYPAIRETVARHNLVTATHRCRPKNPRIVSVFPPNTHVDTYGLFVLGSEFQDVLCAAARGDEGAFARLWRDNHPPLLRYLRVVSGDTAEDVASEVWLEVSRGLPRFRGSEGEFRGWLFTTARRRMIDLRRYAARHPMLLIENPGDLDHRAPDDTATAALEHMSTEAALELIASLPHDQAEIIVLRVIACLDSTQVGRIVGKRPGAVRVAAHRALRTLADRLAAVSDQSVLR
jgi:RNA polymerase sigma-70 factor, ECF subfamily